MGVNKFIKVTVPEIIQLIVDKGIYKCDMVVSAL